MLLSSTGGGRCKLQLHKEITREVLFTGTAAKADSKLVLSTTKTGMISNVPAR